MQKLFIRLGPTEDKGFIFQITMINNFTVIYMCVFLCLLMNIIS